MTEDDLAELMAEPPNGHSFGRRRVYEGSDGIKGYDGWQALESPGEIRSHKHYLEPRWEDGTPREHGTRYTYQKLRCRCSPCRAWAAADRRRQRSVATPKESAPDSQD